MFKKYEIFFLVFLTLVLFFLSQYFRVNKESNIVEFELNTPKKCDVLSNDLKWTNLPSSSASLLNLRSINNDSNQGIQGIKYLDNKDLIAFVSGKKKMNINLYDIQKQAVYGQASVKINAADLTTIGEGKYNNLKFVVTNYDKGQIALLNQDLVLNKIIQLPKKFQSLVGIDAYDMEKVIIPSRSTPFLAIVDINNENSIDEIMINHKGFSVNPEFPPYDVVVFDNCVLLNYRELGELRIGSISDKRILNTTDFDVALNYPQSVAYKNQNLYVIETGSHSLIIYNLKNKTKKLIKLPLGVFRGITIGTNELIYLSGQIFNDDYQRTKQIKSVTNEKEVFIYSLKFQ